MLSETLFGGRLPASWLETLRLQRNHELGLAPVEHPLGLTADRQRVRVPEHPGRRERTRSVDERTEGQAHEPERT